MGEHDFFSREFEKLSDDETAAYVERMTSAAETARDNGRSDCRQRISGGWGAASLRITTTLWNSPGGRSHSANSSQ